VLWSKGEAAMLTIAGEEYQGYDVWTSDGVIWLPGQNIPTGVEWKVTSIAGLEVIPGSSVTITFHPHGKLSGKASVNNYTSSWITSGYRLKITGGVSTQKAGPQNLMDQEERFLKFLSQVDRFEFRREGLALVDKDDEEILLRR
jgi:heat shock protein HslJ